MIYDYVIVGAGIAGCSTSYFLNEKDKNLKILLIDRNSDVAVGASGTAGAFLSPLLGKPNKLKTLVNRALKFSTSLYKDIANDYIINHIYFNNQDSLITNYKSRLFHSFYVIEFP